MREWYKPPFLVDEVLFSFIDKVIGEKAVNAIQYGYNQVQEGESVLLSQEMYEGFSVFLWNSFNRHYHVLEPVLKDEAGKGEIDNVVKLVEKLSFLVISVGYNLGMLAGLLEIYPEDTYIKVDASECCSLCQDHHSKTRYTLGEFLKKGINKDRQGGVTDSCILGPSHFWCTCKLDPNSIEEEKPSSNLVST